MSVDIAVVDYGMGNLRSVSKAIEHVAPAMTVVVTSDPAVIAQAGRVVFPGQGAAPDCMREIDARGLRQVIIDAAHSKPFLGKVIILTDEGSASTSEILAAGLQEAKRAMVVGDNTVGAALGSTIEALPGGADMQIPVAGFKTPKGVSIEGRGVQPDRRVLETRAALLAGHDPVLDEALELAHSAK